MLEVKEFIEKMKEEVRDYLPDDVHKEIIIDDVEVVKMNDQKLHGLTFRMPGSDAAPTLYVDEMYQAYKDGADIGYLATEMANMYSASRNAVKPPEIDLSYDKVKDNLTVRLLEKKRNREFLMSTPHVSVGHGLAVIADINMGEDRGGDWRIAVNHGVMESLGVDKETLFITAMDDSMFNAPAVLTDMSQALFSPEKENLLAKIDDVRKDFDKEIKTMKEASEEKLKQQDAQIKLLTTYTEALRTQKDKEDAKKWRTTIAFILTGIGGLLIGSIPFILKAFIQAGAK